jgi:hypothetical protein
MIKFNFSKYVVTTILLLLCETSKSQNLEATALKPEIFQTKLSSDLNDPSLSLLREKIKVWAETHSEDISIYKEIGELTWSNPNLAETARRVLSNLKQGFGTQFGRNQYKWADFVDLNQDQSLGLLDLLDLELFKTRLEIDRVWPLPQILNSQNVNISSKKSPPLFRKGKDLLPLVEASTIRYAQILATLQQDPNNQLLTKEKEILENGFYALLRQIELVDLQPVIKNLEEVENLLAEAFEKDTQWRHRPANFFRPQHAALSKQNLSMTVANLKTQLATWEVLKITYPTIDFPSNWVEKIQLSFLKIVQAEEILNSSNPSNEVSFETLLSDPSKILSRQNFVYSLKPDSDKWNQEYFFRLNNLSNSEVIVSLLNAGVFKRASWFSVNQMNLDWVDNLTSFFDAINFANFSEKIRALSRVCEFNSLRKSQPLAIEWIARVTKIGTNPDRPSFDVIGETLSWKMLKIPEVNSWAAEHLTSFVDSRLAMIQKIADQNRVNLPVIEAKIAQINLLKTALKLEKAKAIKAGLTDEQDEEFERRENEIVSAVETLHSQRIGVLQSPEVLAFNPEYPKKYQERMGWPSYFDPSRMNQLEALFGFDENAKNLFSVLRFLENQDDWVQIDIDNDGDISRADFETARLLIRSLVQKN